MKKLLTLLFICSAFLATAQTELEQAKKALVEAQAKLKAEQELVNAAKATVAKLTPPVYWKKGGFTSLNFNSLGLTNWAAGGESSNSITALGNIFRNYKKGKVQWENNLNVAYGLIQNEGEDFRKNADKIDLLSKVNYGFTKKLSYSALFNFRSQFAPGFDFTIDSIADNDRQEISRFMAPGFLTTSLGLNYNVTDYFSIYLSPATGRFTFVMDDAIAEQNIYIPATLNDEGVQFYSENYRAEFGALLNARFKKDLTDKINLETTLNLFNNFTDVNIKNRENIDVNWEMLLNMKLTEFLGASLSTQLIHDNDIAIPVYENDILVGKGPRTQFKRLFGIGLSYKF